MLILGVMQYKLSDGQKPAAQPPAASGWQQLQDILAEQNQKLDNQSLKQDEQNQMLINQNQAILSLNQMLQDLRKEISGITSCCNSLPVEPTTCSIPDCATCISCGTTKACTQCRPGFGTPNSTDLSLCIQCSSKYGCAVCTTLTMCTHCNSTTLVPKTDGSGECAHV